MNSKLKWIMVFNSLVTVHAFDPITVGAIVVGSLLASLMLISDNIPEPVPTTCQKVNGGFSEWSSYNECSLTCGGGIKKRSRTCTKPTPACNGDLCNGVRLETQSCNTQKCPDPCEVSECCNNLWVRQSPIYLKKQLNSKLFGQHLVEDLVVKPINDHIENNNPSSPLVMSFHGWTGSGKNFVSQIIANSLFKKGMNSKFVHIKVAAKDFPHKKLLTEYKNELSKHIEKNARLCERTLFIFDEFHEMPEGLGNTIAPYLDYNVQLDGIDYRKNIFIFLSNSVGEIINNYTINHYRSNKSRETIDSKILEKLIATNALNLPGGFKNSNIIKKALINVYVPFLPLERKHIQQCAEEEISKRNKEVKYSVLEAIADEMLYFPDKEQWFSATGCKTVNKKVTSYL
ncbi:torsin-1A [Hydra vulgaris]|uniref:torsin-1A n=1 Tax=Hydra vulgaris TaxID=6087 RepID=UPI0001924CB3|nr:torsin-1A [Hydra vulgaris]